MLSALRRAPAARTLQCARCASSLVLGEYGAGGVSNATRAAVTAAGKLGGPIHVLLAGVGAKAAAASAAQVAGVSKVLYSEEAAVSHGMAEGLALLLQALQAKDSACARARACAPICPGWGWAQPRGLPPPDPLSRAPPPPPSPSHTHPSPAPEYTHVLASATNYGRNVAPRLAVALDVAPISDVTAVVDEATFERPMYAGSALARVRSSDAVKVLTVRATAFEKAGSGPAAAIEAAPPAPPPARAAAFGSAQEVKSERPELVAAGTVVAGGRALKSAENFKLIYALADKMGAAVGASRAAVDAGYVPNELQVGQTGKVVAPALYLAVGISGAIQHLAGMKDSKVIASINKDPDAPIHQVADFALVADLFAVVPEMTGKVAQK